MTSSNGNTLRVTGLCAGNSPVPVNSPHKGQWRGALMFYFTCVWISDWVNNREAGDLRCHRGHYDVTVMEQRSEKMTRCVDNENLICSLRENGRCAVQCMHDLCRSLLSTTKSISTSTMFSDTSLIWTKRVEIHFSVPIIQWFLKMYGISGHATSAQCSTVCVVYQWDFNLIHLRLFHYKPFKSTDFNFPFGSPETSYEGHDPGCLLKTFWS